MPIKKIPNHVSIRERENVVSFFTHSKKNHFDSESKLYETLELSVHGLNRDFMVNLSTYPHIAVHVSFGVAGELEKVKDKLRDIVQAALESHLKPI